MDNSVCTRITYRQAGHEGVGYVELLGEGAKYQQGLLVLDDPDNVPVPWFEARMADIEILEADPTARALLLHAGYRLTGL